MLSTGMLVVKLAERLARKTMTARGVESRYVDTPYARHHLYDARAPAAASDARLPTIVVLHGINSSAAAFAPVIERLRHQARRVIAVEAPGHGFSEPPHVPLSPEVLFATMSEVLVRELSEPAIVCGNSLGGAVALRFALAHPERVRGLFLSSPAGARMQSEAFEGFLKVFDIHSRAEARAFMRRLYHRVPWYAGLFAGDLQEMFARQAVRDVLGSARADLLFSEEELLQLRMPIHLLWGKSDRLMPRENLAFYRASLPAHAVIDEADNTGHCPHMDDPAAFADRVISFARTLCAPR